MAAFTTIDRSRLTFFLRKQTFAWTWGTSLGLFAVLPVAALLCWIAGVLAFLVCVLACLLMFVVTWGGIVGGGLAVLGGLGMQKENKEQGCGVAVIGLFLVVVGAVGKVLFDGWYSPVWHGAVVAAQSCFHFGWGTIVLDAFVAGAVYLWSWIVAATGTALAVLTLLLLVGLWLETSVKYAILRIGYLCPRCHQCLVPHFRCSKCNTLVTDLRPSLYGVWHAACGSCGNRLPTTDLGGRLGLEKVCRNASCREDLTDPALGEMSECGIAVVGAQSAGKTALMLSSVWQFEEDFAKAQRLTMAFASASEEQRYRQAVAKLESGQVPAKTGTTAAPHAFTVSLKPRGGRGTLLYLYDTAGEDFEAGATSLMAHSFDKRIDGIIFVLDPFAEQGWRGRVRASERGRVNPAAVEATEILGQMLPHWERCLHISPNRRFPIPLAVVVTKMDACGLEKELGNHDDVAGFRGSTSEAALRAARESAKVRRFLEAAGLGNFVNVVEERFEQVAYFGATALGRAPDLRNATAFKPRGVLGPLVWLCDRTHALTDSHGLLRVGRHFTFFVRRCLRGAEGGWARLGAWAVLLALLVGIGSGLVWLGLAAVGAR